MTDRLDAIAADLNELRGGAHDMFRVDDVRWLVDEVRRLRQQNAEALEKAWKAGYELGHSDYDAGWPNRVEKAWLASEAKAALEGTR